MRYGANDVQPVVIGTGTVHLGVPLTRTILCGIKHLPIGVTPVSDKPTCSNCKRKASA